MKKIKCKISELGKIVGGGTPDSKNEEFWGNEIPWITPKDLVNHNSIFISSGQRSITKLGLLNSSAKLLPKNSILFSTRAPIGYVAISKNELSTSQGFKSIIPSENIDYLFLFYLLKNNIKVISSHGVGTTFKEISGSVLGNIELLLPASKEEQIKISNILSKIDKKIEINNKINDNLEKQLKIMFSQIINKKNKTKLVKLNEIADLYQPEIVYTKELNDKYPYFVFGANGIIGKYNKYNHSDNEIAIACRGTCGSVYMTLPKSWITSNSMVVKPKNFFPYKEFLFKMFQLKSASYLTTGSVQPQLTKENLSLYEVILPNIEKIILFEEHARKIRFEIINKIKENINLTNLKNFILPLLMNGQVKIID